MRRLIITAAATLGLASAVLADGRNPGSVLIYPVHRSGTDDFTIVSVTNTNTNPAQVLDLVAAGTTNVHYQYVNVIPNPSKPHLPVGCSITDRVETLTPADTLSVLTSCHNAAVESGYLVVSAQDPLLFSSNWSHNYLVGSELVISLTGGMFSINAVPFSSPQPDRTATDRDGDDVIDFDDVEYEGVADVLYMDNFLAITNSSLILVNLTGGTQFTAHAAMDIWNDDEFPLSATLSFKCWMESRLEDISLVMSESFLRDNTPNDYRELDLFCDGKGDLETGWARIRGVVANSSVESIADPALLGALAIGPDGSIDGGRLLWESEATQLNADFINFGANDPELP